MSFVSRNRSKCPCVLAAITLTHTNSAHMLACTAAQKQRILQVDL